jgi:hypothetical protein
MQAFLLKDATLEFTSSLAITNLLTQSPDPHFQRMACYSLSSAPHLQTDSQRLSDKGNGELEHDSAGSLLHPSTEHTSQTTNPKPTVRGRGQGNEYAQNQQGSIKSRWEHCRICVRPDHWTRKPPSPLDSFHGQFETSRAMFMLLTG